MLSNAVGGVIIKRNECVRYHDISVTRGWMVSIFQKNALR